MFEVVRYFRVLLKSIRDVCYYHDIMNIEKWPPARQKQADEKLIIEFVWYKYNVIVNWMWSIQSLFVGVTNFKK